MGFGQEIVVAEVLVDGLRDGAIAPAATMPLILGELGASAIDPNYVQEFGILPIA